jgi:hypothetical protein
MTYLFIYLAPIINFLLFEVFFFKANYFFAVLVISNLLLIIAIARITGKKINSKEFWNFCILPIIFSSFLAIYSLLVVNHYLVQILFILNLFFIFYYLKNIYQGKKSVFLENVSSYGNFLAIFFSFSVIYGLKAFLNTPIWVLILVAAVVIILVIHQTLWAYKTQLESRIIYVFIGCLVLVQIAWAIYFLPFNYNILGLILTICYYMLIGLVKASLGEKLTKRTVKLYLVSGLSCILILLLTAKWA